MQYTQMMPPQVKDLLIIAAKFVQQNLHKVIYR